MDAEACPRRIQDRHLLRVTDMRLLTPAPGERDSPLRLPFTTGASRAPDYVAYLL
jgi:hypothetical protein